MTAGDWFCLALCLVPWCGVWWVMRAIVRDMRLAAPNPHRTRTEGPVQCGASASQTPQGVGCGACKGAPKVVQSPQAIEGCGAVGAEVLGCQTQARVDGLFCCLDQAHRTHLDRV